MKRRQLLLLACDWNGTTLDDLGISYAAAQATFSAFNLPAPSLAVYQKEITANFMEFYYSHGIPRSVTSTQTNLIRKNYFEKRWEEARLQQHAIELFAASGQLGLFLTIVSAEVEEILKKRLEQFAITSYFDKVIGGVKNKGEALRQMLDEFNFLPEEAAYVYDTFDGLMAAKNIDMLPIGVTHGYHMPEQIRAAQPDERYIAYSLHEVQRIVEREIRRRRR